MTAKIISAFPACGKTTYYKKWSQYSPENVWRIRNNGRQAYNNLGLPCGQKIVDSDSSEFSWVKDEYGNNTSVKNPKFPQNYIDHIKEKMLTEDIIFVSSHEVVREALKQNGIPYHIFYPKREQKERWLCRFRERGNDEKFISFISDNWDKFINDIVNDDYPIKHELRDDWTNFEHINTTTILWATNHQEI